MTEYPQPAWVAQARSRAFPGDRPVVYGRGSTAGDLWRGIYGQQVQRPEWPHVLRISIGRLFQATRLPVSIDPAWPTGRARELRAMVGVFRQLYYHVVWATKNRGLQLTEELRPSLFEAIRDKCRRLDCRLHAFNAMEDHIHLALEIPPSRAVSFVVGQLKGASAHALNQLRPGSLHWQDGYGVVTFRRAELAQVARYIATQEQRHRTGHLSPLLETWHEPDETPGPSEEGTTP